MTIREQLNAIASQRILILDGAMGSMIQALNLTEEDFRGCNGEAFAGHPTPLKGCNDPLCLTRPETITAIHEAYLEAGVDIVNDGMDDSAPDAEKAIAVFIDNALFDPNVPAAAAGQSVVV